VSPLSFEKMKFQQHKLAIGIVVVVVTTIVFLALFSLPSSHSNQAFVPFRFFLFQRKREKEGKIHKKILEILNLIFTEHTHLQAKKKRMSLDLRRKCRVLKEQGRQWLTSSTQRKYPLPISRRLQMTRANKKSTRRKEVAASRIIRSLLSKHYSLLLLVYKSLLSSFIF